MAVNIYKLLIILIFRKIATVSNSSVSDIAKIIKKCPSLNDKQVFWRGGGILFNSDTSTSSLATDYLAIINDCDGLQLGSIGIGTNSYSLSGSTITVEAIFYDANKNTIGFSENYLSSSNFSIRGVNGDYHARILGIDSITFSVDYFNRTSSIGDPRFAAFLVSTKIFPGGSLDTCTSALYYIIPICCGLTLLFILLLCCYCKRRDPDADSVIIKDYSLGRKSQNASIAQKNDDNRE